MQTENSYVLVNGEQLNNISSTVHLGYSISVVDNKYTISASVAQFWIILNNIVVAFMVHNCGLLIVIIKYLSLGEKL